jgi:rod shape-determining protein MreC
MESVLGRYRNLIILVGVLFLQVLGLAVQVKRGSTEGQDTRLIRLWAVGAVSPFERALVWVERGAGDIWHNYFYLRGVRAENRQLKDQIEQMRLEQVRLSEDAAQAHRLQSLLGFKEQYIAKTVAAQVIGSSGVDTSRVIYIDKGENAGIKRDMAVITADGIVGKILLVYPTVSQVLLISDQTSGVGVLLSNSRLQGVLVGTATGEVSLNGVMSDEQVPLGENVLTSGGDQIFPKGLPVGTVSRVVPGKDLFLNIKIRPAANLSRLEEVLVLTEKQERQATADSNAPRVRAADILAQRLPSVPDKPATDANAPAGATGTVKAANPASGAQNTKPSTANVAGAAKATATPTPAQTAKTASGFSNGQSTAASANGQPTVSTPAGAGIAKPAPKAKTANAVPSETTPAVQLSPAAAGQKPATPPSVQPDSPPPDPNNPQ